LTDLEALLEKTDLFVDQIVAPNAQQWELNRQMPREIFQQAAGFGLTGIIVPAELGGQDVGVVGLTQVLRKIAAADMACAFSLVVHNNLAGAIANSGNNHLTEAFLPGLLSGDKVGAFLLTEPQGGSDAGAITTFASNSDDGFVLNGEKAWVSKGNNADVLSVYAQTEKGMLCLVVAAGSDGIVRSDPYSMLGGHGLGTCAFTFSNVEVPAGNVLVPEGEGLKAALAGIDIARINVAAMCCGMLEASLAYVIEFARNRQFKGRAITDMQGIQWRLADIATDLAAADALLAQAARSHDENGPSPTLAAKAKKFATTITLRRIADCMQIMGAAGLQQEHPIARHFACAKIAEYLDGTTEIQNLVIARSLLAE
jgi:alkylation response protein AidB-like acyl-CoA dehydrogenase